MCVQMSVYKDFLVKTVFPDLLESAMPYLCEASSSAEGPLKIIPIDDIQACWLAAPHFSTGLVRANL
jgi:hypothetical protein